MAFLDPVDWEILNATADDREDLEQIYLALCFEPAGAGPADAAYRRVRPALLLREVADRVRRLEARGLLAAVDDDGRATPRDDAGSVWRGWFAMTPEGRRLWADADNTAFVEQK